MTDERTFEQITQDTIQKAMDVGGLLATREAQKSLDAACDRIAKLEAVLREIVHEYDQTYDGDQDSDGRWTAAASIPVQTMEAAKRLVEKL